MKRFFPVLMVVALMSACGDDESTTTPDGAARPTISFNIAPANGTDYIANNVAGDGATVTVTVTNISLVDPASHTSNVTGEGHYHAYLDDDSGGDYIAIGFTTTLQIAIPVGTTPGSHRMHLQLQDNTHHPFSGVSDSTEKTFTVVAP